MYQDREEAGRLLADIIASRAYPSPVIFAIPRGGVVVAAPVAAALHRPIDLLIVRKIPHPHNPEVAIGAVMPDGSSILDEESISTWRISPAYIATQTEREFAEIGRRLTAFAGEDSAPVVAGRTVIVVDDGIATGYTVRAALSWLRRRQPHRIVLAVPVAPIDVIPTLAALADEVICPRSPREFLAVGLHYSHFPQLTDEETAALIRQSHDCCQPAL